MSSRCIRFLSPLAAAAACLVLVIDPAASALDGRFVPHRAFYALSLHTARPGSTVTSARGAMYLDWSEDCAGWSSSQRFQLRMVDAVGPVTEIDSRFASWEANDGLSYEFVVENVRNGRPEKQLRGSATLEGAGKGGTAEFIGPEPTRIDLPPGTIFPMTHMVDIIDAALAGEKVVSRLVFDGTDERGVFEVNGVIGPRHEPEGEESVLPASVDRPYWDMRFAFFHAESDEVLPFYELSVEFMENGIARGFLLDYGDSVIRVDLERIEVLPKPTC